MRRLMICVIALALAGCATKPPLSDKISIVRTSSQVCTPSGDCSDRDFNPNPIKSDDATTLGN